MTNENYHKAARFDADVAVIELPSPLTFNDYVQPICLPSSPVAAGTNCVITGWGNTQSKLNITEPLSTGRIDEALPCKTVCQPCRQHDHSLHTTRSIRCNEWRC